MARSLRTLALILATHRALARLGARRTVFDGVRARRGPSTSKVVDVYAVGDRLDRYALALAATEPHGPHLPLGVDAMHNKALLDRALKRLPDDVLVDDNILTWQMYLIGPEDTM